MSAGAYAAAALPFHSVSSQKLAGAARAAETHTMELVEEVKSAQQLNAEHAGELHSLRSELNKRATRIEGLIVRREKHRRSSYEQWVRNIDEEVENRFAKAENRLNALDRSDQTKQRSRQDEYERLLDLFHSQMRLKAPVKLWEKRAETHATKSSHAFKSFAALSAFAILAGVLIPYCAGDYIADSFFTQSCTKEDPPICQRNFSAKGPLTVAGILIIMSLIMWAIRLQYRVFLSERHLALDASEKQAFAETYLSMKEGQDVSSDSEAIVLSSLFRPTQDGIIKDDETTLDLSATAILAKQLSRSNN